MLGGIGVRRRRGRHMKKLRIRIKMEKLSIQFLAVQQRKMVFVSILEIIVIFVSIFQDLSMIRVVRTFQELSVMILRNTLEEIDMAKVLIHSISTLMLNP